MPVRFLLSGILVALQLVSTAQSQEANTYHKKYKVDTIPGLAHFGDMSPIEKQLAGTAYSTLPPFASNRGRLVMATTTNGVEKIKKTGSLSYLPLPCECAIKKDTLLISMAAGMMSGVRFTIKATNDQFQSTYYEYVDDAQPFKTNASSPFTNTITIDSKYQYLVLEKTPAYNTGQQLTGYLTLTTHPWYERGAGDELKTVFVSAKIHFTCTPQ